MGEVANECGAVFETVVFLKHFRELPDHRQAGKVTYPLDEVLLLCLLAVLAGADILFVCAAGPAVAGPYEDGLTAAQKGDYTTAMRLWRLLADQGDARAQFNLGVVYREGQGVLQDYAASVSWYRKAAEQGDVHAQAREQSLERQRRVHSLRTRPRQLRHQPRGKRAAPLQPEIMMPPQRRRTGWPKQFFAPIARHHHPDIRVTVKHLLLPLLSPASD